MNVIVIPAYQPDEQLAELVYSLHQRGFPVLVIDDGSDAAHQPIFNAIASQAAVLRAPKNEGKGAALKRGFAALPGLFPGFSGCITADADGQHKPEDILRVDEALKKGAEMVLTVRLLQGNIPPRSRFGNALSRIVYTIMNGHYFDDNQSGLRGFAARHLSWLTAVKGNKYDYEMNVLCHADKQNIRITTLPMQAVYIDGNKSSHFNPVADTVRIYKRLFSQTWPSLLGVALWELLTLLVSVTLGAWYYPVTVPTAVMLPALLTCLLYRLVVFRKTPYRDSLRLLLLSVIRATAYTSAVRLVRTFTADVPVFLTVNAAALLELIVEYQVHKRMHKVFFWRYQ